MKSPSPLKTEHVRGSLQDRFKHVPLLGYFVERSFLHYLWIGGMFSVLNIALLWLCIDVLRIPTLVASSSVIGGVFVLRYVVYRWLKVM